MVKTNDLKKGTRVRLAYGWEATMMDNMKGNIRLAEVYGDFTEIGSIYSHDIVAAFVDGEWVGIELTAKQRQSKKVSDFLF